MTTPVELFAITSTDAVEPGGRSNQHSPRGPGTGRGRSVPTPTAPAWSGAFGALADARRSLESAMAAPEAAERYALAHRAALRTAAAVLAGHPHPTSRTLRNASAWARLDRVAPDLALWSAYFAAGSAKRQAAEAGITRGITAEDALEMVRQAAAFVDLAELRLRAAA